MGNYESGLPRAVAVLVYYLPRACFPQGPEGVIGVGPKPFATFNEAVVWTPHQPLLMRAVCRLGHDPAAHTTPCTSSTAAHVASC